MGRLIAIGDIHGRFKRFENLIKEVIPQKDDTLVFLGDYIDRGPDSFEVVELVLQLKKNIPNTVTLRGNHEDFVISMFQGNQSKQQRQLWLGPNGGNLTLASYRAKVHYLNVHQKFYSNLPVSWETQKYFFCHAGVRRGVALDKQRESDLLNIRGPYPSPEDDLGKVVVHGHSIVDQPLILSNRINIDTGAGYNGPLTAIELPSLQIWQV